jgi:hypothetical protein
MTNLLETLQCWSGAQQNPARANKRILSLKG